MPRDLDSDFIYQKNYRLNRPIFLYRIDLPDGELRLTSWNEDPGWNGEVWTPWDISHTSIKETQDGTIPTVTVTVGNISREIEAYVQTNNGLRGRKVEIYQIWWDTRTDDDAYIKDTYWIDSANRPESMTGDVWTFTLTSRFDLLNVYIPRRMYTRNFCQFKYKGLGCWPEDEDGNPTEPGSWDEDDGTCDKSINNCRVHKNKTRFGGSPGIPSKGFWRL